MVFKIGERGMIGKNTLYPEATNIPLFFKVANETAKRKQKTNYVSQVDIFPSLIDLHSKNFLKTKEEDFLEHYHPVQLLNQRRLFNWTGFLYLMILKHRFR